MRPADIMIEEMTKPPMPAERADVEICVAERETGRPLPR